jgi:NitT/TauT family transport system substrate-binding protein
MGLKQVGLSKNDVDLQEMAIPNMPAALQNGALDVAVPAEPLVTLMQEQGIGTIMMFADKMFPGMESTQWLYSPQFADTRPDAAVRFMVALLRGARDFNDAFIKGRDKPAIVQILTKYTSVKDPAVYDKMQMPELNANGQLSSANLQQQVDWLLGYKYIQKSVDIAKLSDQQFAEKATAIIGKV